MRSERKNDVAGDLRVWENTDLLHVRANHHNWTAAYWPNVYNADLSMSRCQYHLDLDYM